MSPRSWRCCWPLLLLLLLLLLLTNVAHKMSERWDLNGSRLWLVGLNFQLGSCLRMGIEHDYYCCCWWLWCVMRGSDCAAGVVCNATCIRARMSIWLPVDSRMMFSNCHTCKQNKIQTHIRARWPFFLWKEQICCKQQANSRWFDGFAATNDSSMVLMYVVVNEKATWTCGHDDNVPIQSLLSSVRRAIAAGAQDAPATFATPDQHWLSMVCVAWFTQISGPSAAAAWIRICIVGRGPGASACCALHAHPRKLSPLFQCIFSCKGGSCTSNTLKRAACFMTKTADVCRRRRASFTRVVAHSFGWICSKSSSMRLLLRLICLNSLLGPLQFAKQSAGFFFDAEGSSRWPAC